MAKTSYPKGAEGAARSFLASIGQLGNLQAPAGILRAANRAERALAAGITPTKQDLRGHGRTPEHHGRKAPSHPPVPQRPPGGHGGPIHPPAKGEWHVLRNGDRYIQGSSKALASHALSVAQALGQNVQIAYRGTDGKTHLMGKKGGINPATAKEWFKDAADFRDALALAMDGLDYGGADVDPAFPVEFYIPA